MASRPAFLKTLKFIWSLFSYRFEHRESNKSFPPEVSSTFYREVGICDLFISKDPKNAKQFCLS